MVNPITSVGRNGIHDFILVRISAVVLTLYTLYMMIFFITVPELSYAVWVTFFSQLTTKVFTLLALFAVLIHAWIGLWQVFSDYIKEKALRGVLQGTVILVLLTYLLSGFFIVWGV